MDNPYRQQTETLDRNNPYAASQPDPPRRQGLSPLKIIALIALVIFMAAAAVIIPTGMWIYNKAVVPARLEANGWWLDGEFTGPDALYELYDAGVPGASHLFIDIQSAQLDYDYAPTEADLLTVTKFPHLNAIYIYSDQMQGDWLHHLAELKQLEHLHIDEAQLNDNHLIHIADLTNLIDLSLTSTPITDNALAQLQQLTKLNTLYLDDTNITGSTFHHLANMRNLEYLYLDSSPIDTANLHHIADLPLAQLSLTDTALTDKQLAAIETLAPTLTTLYLDGTNITDAAADSIAKFTKLEYLYIQNTQISDNTLQAILNLPNLTEFFIFSTQITGTAFENAPTSLSLPYLNLDNTPLTDDSLRHIARLGQLTYLSLVNTPITDAGVAHLTPLHSLESLELTGTNTTDAALQHFHNHPTDLTIYHAADQFSQQAIDDLTTQNPRVRFEESDPTYY